MQDKNKCNILLQQRLDSPGSVKTANLLENLVPVIAQCAAAQRTHLSRYLSLFTAVVNLLYSLMILSVYSLAVKVINPHYFLTYTNFEKKTLCEF